MERMRRLKNRLKDENGAYGMIEAAVIYPVVFLLIFVLIYMGLYLLQNMTLTAYAQKIASIAAREVQAPGYYNMSKLGYGNNGIDVDYKVDPVVGASSYKVTFTEGENPFVLPNLEALPYTVDMNSRPSQVKTRAYRYWRDPLDSSDQTHFQDLGRGLTEKYSFLSNAANTSPEVKVECKNNFVVQEITVEIKQELMDFPVLTFFGIETPKVQVQAKTMVNDIDELVRNTDFVVDSLTTLAENLGVDTLKLKHTVTKALGYLGLY